MSETESKSNGDRFAVIAVLGKLNSTLLPRFAHSHTAAGAPEAGRCSLCAYLAATFSFAHYPVSDALREWIRDHKDEPPAARIQKKFDNQGYLNPEDVNPLNQSAVQAARAEGKRGILIDGLPRNLDQMTSN